MESEPHKIGESQKMKNHKERNVPILRDFVVDVGALKYSEKELNFISRFRPWKTFSFGPII